MNFNFTTGPKKSKVFVDVDPKVRKLVTQLNNHPEMITARQNLQNASDKLREVESALNECREPCVLAQPAKGSSRENVERFLAGTPLNELKVEGPASRREMLVTLRDELKTEVARQEQEIVRLKGKLSREECERLRPIAERYINETILAFESLKTALERQETFLAFLTFSGLQENRRPVAWRMMHDHETQILHGGAVPKLEWAIERRRKGLELDSKETKARKRKAV